MAPDLRQELKQTRPFRTLYEEAVLNLKRTSSQLGDGFEQMLKPYGITGTQYNVLRILRGAEPNGLCRNEVSDRLINRMPDATRLLDRMEEAGLVTRARGTDDRRLVKTRITPKGMDLVNSLDAPVEQHNAKQLAHISEGRLAAMIEILTDIRNAP